MDIWSIVWHILKGRHGRNHDRLYDLRRIAGWGVSGMDRRYQANRQYNRCTQQRDEFLVCANNGLHLISGYPTQGCPAPSFSDWIVAKSHEPCAGQRLVPYAMAATSRTRHRFPMREPASARASVKDKFPRLFSSLKKAGSPLPFHC